MLSFPVAADIMTTPKAYFIVLGQRLGAVDVIAPVIDSIKRCQPVAKVYYVFMEDKTFHELRRDSFLSAMLDAHTDGIYRLKWPHRGRGNKPRAMLRALPLFVKMALQPGFMLLHSRGVISPMMRGLAWLARIKGGKCLEFPKTLVPVCFKSLPDKPVNGDEADGYLCFSEKDIPYYQGQGRTKLHPIGYPRMFDAWLERVRVEASGYLKRECGGNCNGDIVPLFLGSSVEGIFGYDELEKWVLEAVAVLRRILPDAIILVKPHPTEDLVRLEALLGRIGDPRVRLTYLHVSPLTCQARFVVAHHSSTIIDALAVGKPVIQFQEFTAHWMKYHPEKSIYPEIGSILAQTTEELEQAVVRILQEEISAPDISEVLGHRENIDILLN